METVSNRIRGDVVWWVDSHLRDTEFWVEPTNQESFISGKLHKLAERKIKKPFGIVRQTLMEVLRSSRVHEARS